MHEHVQDIVRWIANKRTEMWQTMQDNVTDDDKWNRARGAYDILEKLYLEILMITNPHNREDIKKHNEKRKTNG